MCLENTVSRQTYCLQSELGGGREKVHRRMSHVLDEKGRV